MNEYLDKYNIWMIIVDTTSVGLAQACPNYIIPSELYC